MDRSTLGLLTAEARMEREAQLRHFEALDTKAGVVLGFAGILVAAAMVTRTSALLEARLRRLGLAVVCLVLGAALMAAEALVPWLR